MDVYVCFDVEDIVHEDSDDIALDIAEMLAADGITASMFVVGEKARLWERRGRRDVIAAVARHDVGLHTDHHSVHPTVSEYLANREWSDGVAEAMRIEGAAAHDLARIFRVYPPTWATSGSSWAPHIPAATRLLGIPANVYAHVRAGESGACWYTGQLCYHDVAFFPGGEDAYGNDETFEAGLPDLLADIEAARRRGAHALGLFGAHPTRLRYEAFWDALNYGAGVNTDPADYRHAPRKDDATYATGLQNLRRMIHAVGATPGVRLVPVSTIAARVAPHNGRVSMRQVGRLATLVLRTEGVPAGIPLASPAQMLDLLARAVVARMDPTVAAPDFLLSRTVLGPVEPALILEHAVVVTPGETVALCRAVVAHVDRTGHLPTSLPAAGVELGPAALLHLAAWQFLRFAPDRTEATYEVAPGDALPAGTEALVQTAIYEMLPNWSPHRPDLRLDLLAKHTALQCWSLKPPRWR